LIIILFYYYYQGEAVKKELQLRCLGDEEKEAKKPLRIIQNRTHLLLE